MSVSEEEGEGEGEGEQERDGVQWEEGGGVGGDRPREGEHQSFHGS